MSTKKESTTRHLYIDEPECIWCGHFGPNDDPADPCLAPAQTAKRLGNLLKAAELRGELRGLDWALGEVDHWEGNTCGLYEAVQKRIAELKKETP